MWNTTGIPVQELGPAHPLYRADPECLSGIAYKRTKDPLSVLSRHAQPDREQGPRSSKGSMPSFQGRYEQANGRPVVCLDLLAELQAPACLRMDPRATYTTLPQSPVQETDEPNISCVCRYTRGLT